MILALDVGNTNITCGVFNDDELVGNFRITTKMPRTSDEYGMLLSTLLEQNGLKTSDIADYLDLSPARTRAILSKMEDIEIVGKNRNRKYGIKR